MITACDCFWEFLGILTGRGARIVGELVGSDTNKVKRSIACFRGAMFVVVHIWSASVDHRSLVLVCTC